MAGTYSKSLLERESPQYSYVLAIWSGGIAFVILQLGLPVTAWLSYALLAALFAFIWPYKALRWGWWLCLPIGLLIFIDLLVTGNISGVLTSGIMVAKALCSACLGAYVGAKLSIRHIAHRFAGGQVNKKRLDRNEHSVERNLVLKDLATPAASVKPALPSRNSRAQAKAIKRAAHVQGLNAALIKAAQEGNLKRIKLLVAGGADVNATSRDQLAKLMIATPGGGDDIAMGKALFGQEAAPDAAGDKGWTSLMLATIKGQTEVVRALLEHGAQVSAKDTQGWTALRFAVSMNETEILRMLLEAGADANTIDDEGKTALMQAAGENITESLKALLDAGAAPHLKDGDGHTALMIAQKQGYTEIIKLLKEAEAKAPIEIDVPINIPADDKAIVAGKTHKVIKIPRDPYYGLIDRYAVIPIKAALPDGCEETGHEGNEEDCLDAAWRNNIGTPSELGWWLGFQQSTNK
jgi:uncharacterized protein